MMHGRTSTRNIQQEIRQRKYPNINHSSSITYVFDLFEFSDSRFGNGMCHDVLFFFFEQFHGIEEFYEKA